MSAEWRAVVGFEGYYDVSSDGEVRSIKRRRGAKVGLLAAGTTKSGYRLVSLWRDGKGHSRHVHRLVAEAFHGPCPAGMEVRHLDGDRANNVAANLRYGTSSENNWDIVAHGRHRGRNKTHCPHGHEYSDENTYSDPKTGWRRCRTCTGLPLKSAAS